MTSLDRCSAWPVDNVAAAVVRHDGRASQVVATHGDTAAVVENGSRADGRGLIVSSSRAVLYASSGADFADAARAEAERTSAALYLP